MDNSEFTATEVENTSTEAKVEDAPQILLPDQQTHFNGIEISKLSKNQLKKYKKVLKWQEVKRVKRAERKQKLKEKKNVSKTSDINKGPSRKELKRKKMESSPCKISVCLDLSFDYLMIDKDMAKVIKQILRVYTENRRAIAPLQVHLTSFNGRSKNEMSRHQGYENWDLQFHEKDYLDVFSKESLIYLSSESDNVIEKLEEDKVYIIGGLVDHNAHKGICYKKALSQGIAHGRLPITKYFRLNHRTVLPINQVFEILVKVSEGKPFEEALKLVLPKRIPKVCLQSKNDDDSQNNSDKNGN